jgi:GntR family transcriptional regulator of arabinose operon
MKRSEPKYTAIVSWIEQEVRLGDLKAGDKLPSENELAKQFDLSRQTVRQATSILESSGLLERRRGSGTYVRALGQHPVPASMNIGVIMTYLDDYLFPRIIHGIDGVLAKNGYTMQLSLTYNKVCKERLVLEAMLGREVDGFIIEPTKSALPNVNIDLYNEIKRRGLPTVFLHAPCRDVEFPSVRMDDCACGRLAVKYLAERGHKKIAGIFKSDDRQGRRRYEGYMQGMLQYGLEIDERHISWFTTEDIGMYTGFTGQMQAAIIKARLQDCTAVVCYNDQTARQIMPVMEACGLRVPDDISLVSFDDSSLATAGEVGLTTFEHPKEELGAATAQMLLSLIRQEETDTDLKFPAKLIERDSVKDLR